MSRRRLEPGALEVLQREHDPGQRRLVVVGAAAEIIAVFLAKVERVVLPVGRLASTTSMCAISRIGFLPDGLSAGQRAISVWVLSWSLTTTLVIPGLAEFGGEQRWSACGISPRPCDGRDLDDLLEQVALGLLARIGRRLGEGGGRNSSSKRLRYGVMLFPRELTRGWAARAAVKSDRATPTYFPASAVTIISQCSTLS